MAQSSIVLAKAKELSLKFRLDVHHDMLDVPRFGFFVDGDSAFTKHMRERQAGLRLMNSLERGDTLLVARMDRLVRSMVDFITITGELEKKGVRLVICNPRIDLGTADGRQLARSIASFAEWESDRRSERTKAALAAKKARKKPEIKAPSPEQLPSDWRPLERDEKPQHKPGRIHFYFRCSHRDSVQSGLGLMAQHKTVSEYAARMMADNPLLTMGEEFNDMAVSGRDVPMHRRLGGKQMLDTAKPGDHVLFSNLDRGFRSLKDLVNTLPTIPGVGLHFIENGVSNTDPSGVMLLQLMAIWAEMEAQLISERTTEARAQAASRGRFCGGKLPSFWELHYSKSKNTTRMVLSRIEMKGFRLIQWYRYKGFSIEEACDRCERLITRHDKPRRLKRPPIPASGCHPNTRLSARLPRDYPRDKNGVAWPLFNKRRYEKSLPQYPKALEVWRQQAAIRRETPENKLIPGLGSTD